MSASTSKGSSDRSNIFRETARAIIAVMVERDEALRRLAEAEAVIKTLHEWSVADALNEPPPERKT